MRKDVKLGFAIGGVLLAVLIVYVLVVPGGGDKRVASATGEASQSGNGSGVSLEPVAPTTPATQPSGATAGATGTPPPAAPATFTPPASGTDPFEQPDAVATNTTTNNNNVKDVDWSKLLNDSQMLMVQTPSKPVVSTPVSSSSSSAAESKPTEVAIAGPTPDITKPGPTPVTPPPAPAPEQPAPPPPPQSANPPSEPAQANSNDGAGGAAPTVLEADPPAPGGVTPPPQANDTGATTADATGQKIHVVQPGESFSTISMIAYGNPNLYAAIMRANPGVDPQKLRPGMKINIPPASEAMPAPKPAAAAPTVATPPAPRVVSGETAQTAKAEQPIDPQTQYRVQPGDNLYSISKKLYGRGDRYLRLHEANKQTLGEDANTLKAGMVLSLPEPPTAK